MIELFSNWVKQRRRQDRPRSSNLKINFEGRLICKGCEDLERRCVARMEYFENYGNRDERRWVTIHPNYAELESYAEIGCATCRVWRKLLLQQCSSHDLALSLAQSLHGEYASGYLCPTKYRGAFMGHPTYQKLKIFILLRPLKIKR